jgi:hypothetical protein
VTLLQLEIEHIRCVLEATNGICEAAKWLGIDRGTVRKKIDDYGIKYVKRPRRKREEGAAPSNQPRRRTPRINQVTMTRKRAPTTDGSGRAVNGMRIGLRSRS